MKKEKEKSIERLKSELRQEINKSSYIPYERNHQYKITIMKNPAEKERAKHVKSAWKSAARSVYGENWKILSRRNGYSV